MILGLGFRLAWAVGARAWRIVSCAEAGHPGAYWRDGVRRCECGRKWPA